MCGWKRQQSMRIVWSQSRASFSSRSKMRRNCCRTTRPRDKGDNATPRGGVHGEWTFASPFIPARPIPTLFGPYHGNYGQADTQPYQSLTRRYARPPWVVHYGGQAVRPTRRHHDLMYSCNMNGAEDRRYGVTHRIDGEDSGTDGED